MKLFKKVPVTKIKNIISNLFKILSMILDDIFLIIGIVLIAVGVFKIFIPAGYIILGICFIGFAFFIAKGNTAGRK